MNPYLEHPDFWTDFHQTFIPAVRAALTPQVVPNYFVQVQEHLYLREVPEDERRLLGMSDVNLARRPAPEATDSGTTAAVLTAPAEVTVPELVKERLSYLEVFDRKDNRVVSVIELLSPSNKYAGNDRESFLTKRREVLTSGASYVELDLLRGGPRLPMRDLPTCDYYALVSRPAKRPKAEIWPVRLRETLPPIPIPLGPGDPDAVLDLQAVLHRVYDEAGYEHQIYKYAPEPRLAPTDAAWAAGLVPATTSPG
jgi:hypothetical protein